MKRLLLGLALVAAPACGLATSGLGGSSSSGSSMGTGGGGGPGQGTGDRDAGNDAAPPPDAGPPDSGPPPVGDSLPPSAVSFFPRSSCPVGWVPYTVADGRFLVPTIATYPGGLTYGTPLASGEDRTHTHTFAATINVGSTSYVGSSFDGENGGVGTAGTQMVMGTTDPASTGLPYIQLLVCRKNAPAVPGSAPLPHGMQMFFDMSACPVGWAQTATTQGRLVVGLPQGAPQDVTFGGPALSTVDGGTEMRTHAHGNTVTLTTTSHGIDLAGNGSATGYAANGTYTAMQPTDDGDTGLPYIELLQCQKQ